MTLVQCAMVYFYILTAISVGHMILLPVALDIVLKQFRAMNERMLELIEDTQLVHGTPAHLVEHKQETSLERVKVEKDVQRAKVPQLGDVVRF